MKKLFALCLFFSLLSSSFAASEIYTLKNYVTDRAGILTVDEKKTLNSKLKEIETNTKKQIVVLIVNKIDGYTIEEYSLKIATKNKLGNKQLDNGVLLLFNMGTREVRIEVGYGLEASLTDVRSARIIREQIVPNFKKKHYYTGIHLAINKINSLDESSPKDDTKNDFFMDDHFYQFSGVILLIGLILSIRAVKSIREFRLLKMKQTFGYGAVISLALTGYIYLFVNEIAIAVVIAFIIATIIVLLFGYVIPFILAALTGNLRQILFIISLNSLKSRDSKIEDLLEAYSRTINSFDAYKYATTLRLHYSTFSKFRDIKRQSFLKKGIQKNCYEDKRLYTNLYLINGEPVYEVVVICYKGEKELPDLFLVKSSSDNLFDTEVTEFETVKELKKAIRKNNGLWKEISGLSFSKKSSSSDSSSGGSSSSSSFSGGGGSFGGGGASGRW